MERSTVLGSTTSYHLTQGGEVGGQLVAYFILAVPSCNCLDRFKESDKI